MAAKTHPASRRRFLAVSAATAGLVAIGGSAMPFVARAQPAGKLVVPKLPYADNALAPVISAQTIGFHYGKHHIGYADAANRMLETDALHDQPLIEIIKSTVGNPGKAALFNAAAQVWNHTFYWNSLRPNGGGKPSGRLAGMIEASFGDFDKFKAAFAALTIGQFASGWGWLCREGGKLTLRRTGNADTPVYVQGVKPLLTIDVWEHAYYLDYQNRRTDYVNAVIDKLINWEFADRNLG
ncbi:MAG: Fe-Mn family superoxide dismutase [Alphaproteobacteria bacterium]